MKRITLPFIAFLLTTTVFSQELAPQKKWRIASFGARISAFSNNYGDDMSYKDIQRMLKDPNSLSVETEGLLKSENFYTNLSGGKLGVQVQLDNQLSEAARKSLVLFADLHIDSELMLDYEYAGSYDYIGWCLLRDRFDIGLEYNYTVSYKDIGISFGPSVTFGKSFNDRLLIIEDDTDMFNPSEETEVRGYTMLYGHLLGKLSYEVLQDIEVFGQLKYGIGYELGQRSINYLTRNATTFSFGFNYKL